MQERTHMGEFESTTEARLYSIHARVLYKLCYNLSVIIGAFISHERGGVQSWKIHYKNCEPTETFAKDRSISTKSG